jgi:hypothetical protein
MKRAALTCSPGQLPLAFNSDQDTPAKKHARCPVGTGLRGASRRDRLVGAAARARVVAIRPDVEVALLDAPHLVLQRRPVEAAASIARFLATHGVVKI